MGRNSTVSRDEILRAAARAFFDNGYRVTSLDSIADALDINKGSVGFRFKSKENLLVEVIAHNLRQADEEVFKRAFTSDRSPLGQLKAFLRLACEFQKANVTNQGCFFGRMSLEVADRSEVVRLKLKQAFDQYLSHLSIAIVQAQQAGEIRSDVDPDELAYFILAQLEGAMVLVKTYRDSEQMERSFKRLVTLLEFLSPDGVEGPGRRRASSGRVAPTADSRAIPETT